jgi:predicted nucleic acid-binding protein
MFVFDASTLILITKAELLGPFLAGVKVEVAIPVEVARESCGAKKTLDALMIQKALDESKIKVIRVTNKKLLSKLQNDFSLGRGEAEAIALALKERAELLGIDDKCGINACKLLGIPFTTALSILVRGFENGSLDRNAALAKFVLLSAYGRYSKLILSDARIRLEARR